MVPLILLGVGTLVVLSLFIGFSVGRHQSRSEIRRQAAVRRAIAERRRPGRPARRPGSARWG